MNNRMLGMIWERESRKILKEKFNTEDIFKLINPERIDWFIFYGQDKAKIALVESKFTKKDKYYPFENKKKRAQIQEYFQKRNNLRARDLICDFFFLIKKGKTKEIFFEKIETVEQIKKSY
ncbi:MAG: hypothetical protein KAG56_03390 [Sulfurovaceae bacterium]|nr:hypothetical protein [Sulfurovaceae bacterium]